MKSMRYRMSFAPSAAVDSLKIGRAGDTVGTWRTGLKRIRTAMRSSADGVVVTVIEDQRSEG